MRKQLSQESVLSKDNSLADTFSKLQKFQDFFLLLLRPSVDLRIGCTGKPGTLLRSKTKGLHTMTKLMLAMTTIAALAAAPAAYAQGMSNGMQGGMQKGGMSSSGMKSGGMMKKKRSMKKGGSMMGSKGSMKSGGM